PFAQPRGFRRLLEQPAKLARRRRLTVPATGKQPALFPRNAGVMLGRPRLPPLPQQVEDLGRKHHITVLAAFRLHDAEALSRCRAAGAKCRRLRNCQAAATAVRHAVIATARSARCVWAETRWRWTLKVLWTAACVERNFWAEPGLLNRCILRSRRRVGWCEFSARLFFHRPRSRRRSIPRSRTAALYDRKSSVTNRSGTKAYFFRSLRISFSVACLLRFDWTSTSRTSPSASTARQR